MKLNYQKVLLELNESELRKVSLTTNELCRLNVIESMNEIKKLESIIELE